MIILITQDQSPPHQKETTTTTKERPNLQVEVKAKKYYGLKTMARKFRKYGQVKRILMHLQNAPIYYAKYKNEESEVKAMMELKEGVAEVTATEEKNEHEE